MKKSIQEKICIWKIVAINDDNKRALGKEPITLSKDKPCYECDGYNLNCEAYHSSQKK